MMVLEIKNQFLYLKQHEDIFSIVSDLFVLVGDLFVLTVYTISKNEHKTRIYKETVNIFKTTGNFSKHKMFRNDLFIDTDLPCI